MAQPTGQPTYLPEDFLSEPSPNLKASRIDFSKTELPEYEKSYAVIIDNALSKSECRTLLRAAEATAPETGWERAMVNIGGGKQALYADVRNCGRIIWDDCEVAAKIVSRIEHEPEVQEILRLEGNAYLLGGGPVFRNEAWKFTRANERLRFLKYTGGEFFGAHCDGMYETPDRRERSYMTLHLYLNGVRETTDAEEAAEEPLEGGATTFYAMDMRRRLDVEPKAGRILIFSQRHLLHSGEDVIRGEKCTMRTDLMYSLEGSNGTGKQEKKWVD